MGVVSDVLIADDSQTVRHMLRGWLREAGYTPQEAVDGQEALESLRANAGPLIVLLDYEMPRLNGFEALQQAQREGLMPPRFAYVIISSMAANFPPAFSDLLRQLAIQILPKPFDRAALLEVVAFVSQRLAAV